MPVPVPYADLDDPQTMNLYGYVRDLPTTKADLDGHGWWKKLWNSTAEDGCWCEDAELKTHQQEARKRRAAEEAEDRRRTLEAYLRWAKKHPDHPQLSWAFRQFQRNSIMPMAGFSVPEQAIADWLIASGEASTVTPITPTGVAATADALLDGTAQAEFKTLETLGTNTLKNAIENAARQGERIIVDARNVPLDKAAALQQIERAQGNIGGLQGRVIVITSDGPVKY